MQNLIYDKAVYDILYYDANLEAYRTDRFAGWQNQPIDTGEPFFTYSTLQYTKLTDAKAAPTPGAIARRRQRPARRLPPARRPLRPPRRPARPGAATRPGRPTPILIGVVIAVIAIVAGVFLANRRQDGGRRPSRTTTTTSSAVQRQHAPR